MISTKYKCIFIHVPKTAGTSIERKLGLFDALTRNAQDHRTIRQIRPLSLLRHGRYAFRQNWPQSLGDNQMARELLRLPVTLNPPYGPRATYEQFQSYFKFTVVRNPWARIASLHRNLMADPKHGIPPCDLRTFLRDHSGFWMALPQLRWLKDFDGSLPFDRIVRFEQLLPEIEEILKTLGFRDLSLPHLIRSIRGQPTNSTAYRKAYDDESAELVAERYREEIDLFGYEF